MRSKLYELSSRVTPSYSTFTLESELTNSTGTLSDGSLQESSQEPSLIVEANVDPSDALRIGWHNINVFVHISEKKSWLPWKKSTRTEDRQVLKNVSGVAEPGSLLAIMGASGAGKTTLLNVLTGRSLEKLEVQGSVTVNGRPAKGSAVTRMSAYVQQDDLFIGNLTVKEHLVFQAELRMDKSLTKKDKLGRVSDVLQELGLTKCANTLIGIPGRVKGISGGEMKRLAFASEVLTNPSLMFCDEPTSGLDSFMAQSVVSVLKEMAAGGRTIVCTIHQPSSETYAMFDKLLLMADGRVAFQGRSRDVLDFFARMGMRCPLNFNPADFFIEQLAIIPGKETECRQKSARICDEFSKTSLLPDLTESTKAVVENDTGSFQPEKAEAQKFKYRSSWLKQMRMLLWRCSIVARRERLLTLVRFVQTIVVSLVVGLIYNGQEMNQDGIININGAIFLLLTNMSFQNSMSVVTVFCEELPVFLREHWSGIYRTDTYFLSKTLAELPIFTVLPALLMAIVYWWIGFYGNVYSFLLALFISALVGNCASSFGYMISGLSKSSQVAASVVAPLIVPLMLFGGFFLNNKSVPNYLVWIKYLSWFYYGNEALSANQWKDVHTIGCSNSSVICLKSGDLVLRSLSFSKANLYPNIGYLLALILGFRLVAFLGVLYKSRRRI